MWIFFSHWSCTYSMLARRLWNKTHIVITRTCHRKEKKMFFLKKENNLLTYWLTVQWEVSSLIQKKAINQQPLGCTSAEPWHALFSEHDRNSNMVMMCFSCWLIWAVQNAFWKKMFWDVVLKTYNKVNYFIFYCKRVSKD